MLQLAFFVSDQFLALLEVFMTQNCQLAYSKELNFKMIKNGVYVVVIALLVAKLFKILIYANYRPCDIVRWTQNDVKSQKMEDFFCK